MIASTLPESRGFRSGICDRTTVGGKWSKTYRVRQVQTVLLTYRLAGEEAKTDAHVWNHHLLVQRRSGFCR